VKMEGRLVVIDVMMSGCCLSFWSRNSWLDLEPT
jgi:hypothetical protein